MPGARARARGGRREGAEIRERRALTSNFQARGQGHSQIQSARKVESVAALRSAGSLLPFPLGPQIGAVLPLPHLRTRVLSEYSTFPLRCSLFFAVYLCFSSFHFGAFFIRFMYESPNGVFVLLLLFSFRFGVFFFSFLFSCSLHFGASVSNVLSLTSIFYWRFRVFLFLCFTLDLL